VLDFTSALYLGFEHPSWSLAEWERLTVGKPAWLEDPPGARELQRQLAALVGCERAVLGPSTLHLYWDLFGALSSPRTAFLLDGRVYAIARWGAQRAASLGSPVMCFPSHDPDALRTLLSRLPPCRPVVVVDGFCPTRGEPAPLERYVSCVAARGGLVVVDDTQALGIFGQSPESLPPLGGLSPVGGLLPFGRGGGGSLRHHRLRTDRVVLLSSMAKGFGVPLAMLAGSERLVRKLERESVTRIHCSPPSVAAIGAGLQALIMNRWCGEARRRRLASRIALFRRGLGDRGLCAGPGFFPVLVLRTGVTYSAVALYQELLKRGVRSVLLRDPDRLGACVAFAITARHRPEEIEQAVSCLTDAIRHCRSESSRGEHDDEQHIELPGRAFRVSANSG